MPNENTPMAPVAETTLTPAEMFLADLNAPEVSSPEAVSEDMPVETSASEAPVESNELPPEFRDIPAQPVAEAPVSKEDILATVLEAAKQNPVEEPTKAVTPEETQETAVQEEEPEISDDKINEDFYSNPAAAIRELANKIAEKNVKERLSGLQEELKPLLEQSKAAKQRSEVIGILGDFLDKNGDAKNYYQDIANYVKENNLPINNPQTYMDAYREAKLKSQGNRIAELEAQAQAGSRSLDDYLNDEGSLSQILANDNVKARVIEDYLKTLQNGARPATISSSSSTRPVGMDAYTADNMNDAGRMFLDELSK